MPSHRKQQWSWALYDWGNSAFATTVLAGFFPIFFNQYWAADVAPQTQTLYQGITATIASVVVMLLAPWLGMVADQRAAKKRFLAGFTALGVVTTAALYLVGQGQWLWAMGLSVLGRIGFFGGLSFYDALLINVARADEMDRVSSLGYSLGYLGGGVLFAVNVAMALKPELFGLADAALATRVAFVMVALWWLVFALPLFRFVPEGAASAGEGGWSAILSTFGQLRQHKSIWLFLLAYWLYIDGVDTVIVMAVDFGMKLGFASDSLIVALLLVQFVGFPAALVFGWLGERLGTRQAIFMALAVYAAVTVWAYFLQTVGQFYAMAAAIGCVQGGVQALSRAYYARLIPADQAGEFFGFYNMLGKFAAVLGPLIVGITAQLSGSPRLAILSLLVFFVAGGVLLAKVQEPQAR
ncbi:MFS transporter [Sinimarinibacterium sp. NLF-5-8]|uniref:MFS transporter n=1 Tax=Sinimarinibacterium sp. NLF-5-8 TaxID=2698684 RepID=UPI00137C3587|nr:MFS transporter [Sinimarinibacterium sp. NLF-5-8]QHS08730.1 MFS transporter [Sinimarinibacterium sp. NLF-5-8]